MGSDRVNLVHRSATVCVDSAPIEVVADVDEKIWFRVWRPLFQGIGHLHLGSIVNLRRIMTTIRAGSPSKTAQHGVGVASPTPSCHGVRASSVSSSVLDHLSWVCAYQGAPVANSINVVLLVISDLHGRPRNSVVLLHMSWWVHTTSRSNFHDTWSLIGRFLVGICGRTTAWATRKDTAMVFHRMGSIRGQETSSVAPVRKMATTSHLCTQLLAVLWTGLPCPMGAGHCDDIVSFSPVDTLLETIITPILGKCVFHLFLFFLCLHFSELNALKFTWLCAGKYERYWLYRLRL
mmetsp:Transcript_59649/g.94404  ORF Transcript_59649/g.94404 Transcript_59649/m.94404 type:complete len:292 (+) Transcript_59649:921-1796(+)